MVTSPINIDTKNVSFVTNVSFVSFVSFVTKQQNGYAPLIPTFVTIVLNVTQNISPHTRKKIKNQYLKGAYTDTLYAVAKKTTQNKTYMFSLN